MIPASPKKAPWWLRLLASVYLSACFILVYNGCNYLASIRDDVGTCAFPWELDLFAFIPILIIPYWSEDLLFFLAALFISNRFLLAQHVKRITFGILVSGVFFVLFPLKLAFQRPEVTGWLAPFFSSLENFNNFYNCAPSLHIVLLTNLWAVYFTFTKKILRPFVFAWFVLIEASTLFCWQHHLMDVFTGQLLGLFCLVLFPNEPSPQIETDLKRYRNSSLKIGRWYALATLVLVALAVAGWPSSMLLLWPATSCLVLCLAYLGGGPNWFQKVNGRQGLAARWLLNPYRWVALLTARFFNRKGPALAELEPGLYIGKRLNESEAKALHVPAVLDLSAEYDECEEFLNRTYLNIPILDLTCPSMTQLQEALAFLKENPQCYVHCSLGRGRTGLIAAAYLISKGMSVDEAIERVREVRPNLHLAKGAIELLADYHSRQLPQFPPQ